MDQAALVDSDIEAGREVVKALKQAHFPFNAAMWLLTSDDDEYRFLVASKMVTEQGPIAAYERVRNALAHAAATSAINLHQIQLVKSNDPLVETLASYLKTTRHRSPHWVQMPNVRNRRTVRDQIEPDFRVRNASIDNRFIRDAIIYWIGPSRPQ